MDADGAPQTLVTWVDVARRLSSLEPAHQLWRSRPGQLVAARADWTSLTLTLADLDALPRAIEWLHAVFPSRIARAGSAILLDGPEEFSLLPIDHEISDDYVGISRPRLGNIEGEISFLEEPYLPSRRSIPLIACHSVKGGTGRTTTAVAIASILARRQTRPILVVDADLEAPGLSYLVRASRPEFLVSLEDIVALAHAEPDAEYAGTVKWAVSRLPAQRFGDIIILPLRRDLDELASSAIRAEHLSSASRPFAFADLLEKVASALGCGGVVVDVRAGLVPLAVQLVLDPSVSRVVVTSLSGQSLEATAALMQFTARELRRSRAELSPPLLVVNRIPGILRDLGQDEALLAPTLEKIIGSLLEDRTGEAAPNEPVLDDAIELDPLYLCKVGEVADLQVPARRWEGFSDQLENSGFLGRLAPQLIAWLDALDTGLQQPAAADATPEAARGQPAQTLEQRRQQLAAFAARLVSAETADRPIETPLITGPMRALALESSQVPIVVVEGAKGTGKTLTARYLLSQRLWSQVTRRLGAPEPHFDGSLLPVLGSVQTSATFLREIDEARAEISKDLEFGGTQHVADTRSYLRSRLTEQLTEREWADIWLDVIAWSAGVSAGRPGAGPELLEKLRSTSKKLVCLVEGVEELYESSNDKSLPPMLRAILIDLPLRLRSEPGRPLGLIVFARRDSVNAGVTQNRNQFRAQYRDFALTWTEGDVLELAAWVATQANSLDIWTPEFAKLSTTEKEHLLTALWGRKLGPEEQPGQRRVQEAYTAGWVIAALSDLQGRLVARDLVRFLQNAAEFTSQADDRQSYGGRLLFPNALKGAIGPTSRQKVQETEEEIPDLAPVFAKFRAKNNSVKAPLDQEAVAELGLTLEDIELLQLHGIVLGDAPPYEVPELFRMGLGLKHAGARHSVLGTKRRARQRLDASSQS